MKNLFVIFAGIFATNAFAGLTIIDEHFKQSPGVISAEKHTTIHSRKLSKKEIQDILATKKESLPITLKATAYNTTGKAGQNVMLHSDHYACFMNTTTANQQARYHFQLTMEDNYMEDERTILMTPEQETCITQKMEMNVLVDLPGKYNIVAMSIGSYSPNDPVSVLDMKTLTEI